MICPRCKSIDVKENDELCNHYECNHCEFIGKKTEFEGDESKAEIPRSEFNKITNEFGMTFPDYYQHAFKRRT